MITTNPWRHQREAADFALARRNAMLCVPMGGGKSLSALIVAAEAEARSIVILCPLSVVGVWRREFVRHAPGAFTVLCPSGGVKEKAQLLADQIARAEARGQRFAVALNYEAAWREPLASLLTGRAWDLLILEESHRIKSPWGKASKFATDLARCCRRRLALTGTPAPHSPLDLFAQARAVDPKVFGFSFVSFRNRYAVTHPQFPGKVTKWINQGELQEKFKGLAYQCDLTGVLDVPEATDQVITVRLGAKARRLYSQLEAEMWAAIDKGEVSVGNALTRLLRLQQITSGHVATDDGKVIEVDDAKRAALADLLEDVPAEVPVVVFCRFVRDLDAVAEVAEASGRAYGEISGRRKDLTPQAEMPAGVGLMGVQIQSGGVGIDLTRAGVAVYFSTGLALGDYLQSRARLHRPGQKRHVSFLHLVAEATVDETVMEALERKQEVVETVLMGRQRAQKATAA
jgi:SNF2 family DNA or RNA helicase